MLVLGDPEDTEAVGCVLSGGNSNDAGERFNPGRIDGLYEHNDAVNAGLPDEFSGQANIVAVPSPTGHWLESTSGMALPTMVPVRSRSCMWSPAGFGSFPPTVSGM